MNYQNIIDQYYSEENALRRILLVHSRQVTERALRIADAHPELAIDRPFVQEAAMLHDIGIFLCDAPGIACHGKEPYICHGRLGAELLRQAGYPRHARVCERHTGRRTDQGGDRGTTPAHSRPGFSARDAGRTADLLCRQVLLQEPPRQGEDSGAGRAEPLQVWSGGRSTLPPVAATLRT